MSAGATRMALDDVRNAPSLLEGMRAIEGLSDAAAAEDETAETVRVLLAAILDPTDQLAAIGAVLALGGVRHERSGSALITVLREGPSYLRDHAAWALGGCEHAPQRAAPPRRQPSSRATSAACWRSARSSPGPCATPTTCASWWPGVWPPPPSPPRVHVSSRRWVSCPATRPSRCCGPSPSAISRTRRRAPRPSPRSATRRRPVSVASRASRPRHPRSACSPCSPRSPAPCRRWPSWRSMTCGPWPSRGRRRLPTATAPWPSSSCTPTSTAR